MQTISINSNFQLNVQVVLEGVNQLDTLSLEHFADKVNTLVAKRKAVSLSEQETLLLKQINKGIAPKISNRFNELQQKQRASKLSKQEQIELNALVDKVELQEAKRLEAMITLAQVWNISLEELRDKLQIKANSLYVW